MENKLPISRIPKFYSENDFDFEIQLGQEYFGDLNMKLVIYRVDKSKTENDDVYAEVSKDNIKFLSPVEIIGMVKVDTPKNSSYKGGMIRYNEPGNLTFSVYLKDLEDLKIDIRFGDYVGYPESEDRLRFYTVSNDGKVVSDNKHTLFGYKPHYRTITCVPTQENEFRGV
jgi:hypothetical protein